MTMRASLFRLGLLGAQYDAAYERLRSEVRRAARKGESPDDIAAISGLTPGQVRSMLPRDIEASPEPTR